ncbi:MAG: metallophosphoesterase [Candidatus Binatia bacterium]|nr:metallophosphoesterase [Candidatus Binatia bacterium]
MNKILRFALVALSGAEVLILHWAILAYRGLGIGAAQALVGFIVAFATNLVLFPMARRRIRAEGIGLVFSRGWIIGSIAALWAGILLAVAFLFFGTSVWLLGWAIEIPDAARALVLAGGGGLAIALGFGSILWGYLIGQRWVSVKSVELPLRGSSSPVPSVQIAQITDLHIGPMLRAPKLRGYVDRINRLEPDLIVITGDIFDFDPQYIDEGCIELGRLRAKHGVLAVLGNHDVYTGVEAVVAGLGQHTEIRVLRDEWIQLDIDGKPLCIAGIEDPGEGWREKESEHPALELLGPDLPPHLPRLLLAHRPSYFAHAARVGFPIVLAGHTHGGQLRLPFARNFNVARIIAHWTSGRFDIGDSTLYVSQGLGVAGLPVRLNCPREISLIRLVGELS